MADDTKVYTVDVCVEGVATEAEEHYDFEVEVVDYVVNDADPGGGSIAFSFHGDTTEGGLYTFTLKPQERRDPKGRRRARRLSVRATPGSGNVPFRAVGMRP